MMRITHKKNAQVIGIVLLLLANSACKFNHSYAIAISSLELLILLAVFIFGGLEKYILTLFLILSTSLEIQLFVTDGKNPLYCFYNIPVIKGYHLYILFLLPIFYIVKSNRFGEYLFKLKNQFPLLKNILLGFTILQGGAILATVMTLFSGKVPYIDSPLFQLTFRRTFLTSWVAYLSILYISYCLIIYKGFSNHLIKLFENILIALVIASICSLALGWRGDYAHRGILLLSQTVFYGIILILYPLYQKKSYWYFIAGASLAIILSKVSTGIAGKWWIFLMVIVVAFIIMQLKNHTKKGLLFISAAAFTGVFITVAIILGIYSPGSLKVKDHASNKLAMSISAVKVWDKDWYKNMSASPKYRIEEFINIGIEFVRNPQFLLFGKGYVGGVSHYWGDLNWDIAGSTFTQLEIENEYYVNLHEAINVIFLRNGLVGLFFFFYMIVIFICNWNKNIWVIPGAIWFLFFFEGYYSLQIGAAFFVSSFYLIDQKKLGSSESQHENR